MAYPREFEDDVFISYAHLDNQPLKDGGEGWISKFHRLLEVLLRKRLGVDPVIWRDIDLSGNDYLTDKLVNRISKVALLVSVVSPVTSIQVGACVNCKSFAKSPSKRAA